MQNEATDVWVTGVGLLSSLGEGNAEHFSALSSANQSPSLNEEAFRPYAVHPLANVDFGRQIAKKSDQRQMELWQRIGVYAAGQALEDAGVAKDPALLQRTNLIVAAGSGERDTSVDARILETISPRGDTVLLAKEILPTALRPTLFLAQLSNLLAGNISIVHNVTGSSRTFMGEEMAGMSAIENAFRRIRAGQGEIFLVGGALNAEREDLLLGYELGCNLWTGPFQSVWNRQGGGGFIPGSVGAFLVLESRCHAEARGRIPYARLVDVVTDRSNREPGDAVSTMERLLDRLALQPGTLPVLSGASGAEPVTGEERAFLSRLSDRGHAASVRAYGTRLGHSVEAHFPAGIALAALSIGREQFYPPFDSLGLEAACADPARRVMVTALGHWRGEALAILEATT